MERKCQNCGSVVAREALFCLHCGTILSKGKRKGVNVTKLVTGMVQVVLFLVSLAILALLIYVAANL